jgi:hypothetical protein
MDKDQVIAALKKYEARLGVESTFTPERLDEVMMGRTFIGINMRAALNHVLWMCIEAQKFVEEGRMEKAMRWLGFIQGVLWATSFFSINDMKIDNMPPGEKFSATRV